MCIRNWFSAFSFCFASFTFAQEDLTPYSKFNSPLINESSGIVKSRTYENVYWTHNDSGDEARLFPVNRNGELLKPEWMRSEFKGIAIGNAVNIDWEELAIDNHGNLYIGAFGNNGNARRDLGVYLLREPYRQASSAARVLKLIPFEYPDQKAFPPEKKNFDCEAFFWAKGKLYFLTKHRSDTRTKLYRLDSEESEKVNTLTYLSSYETRDWVTAADATIDGSKIAVLTTEGAWIFQKPNDSDNYLAGKALYKPFKARQCEAICWDGDQTLIITNEQQDLFELKESEFQEVL